MVTSPTSFFRYQSLGADTADTLVVYEKLLKNYSFSLANTFAAYTELVANLLECMHCTPETEAHIYNYLLIGIEIF